MNVVRAKAGDSSFSRLKDGWVPEEGQDVLPEDIHYYDEPPFSGVTILLMT